MEATNLLEGIPKTELMPTQLPPPPDPDMAKHKEWQKRKRASYAQRRQERRALEWNDLSEEEKERRKQERRDREDLQEQRLAAALAAGVNVCVDLSFDDGVSAADAPSSSSGGRKARPLVSDKERTSICKQLSLSWATLRCASSSYCDWNTFAALPLLLHLIVRH